CAADAEPFDGHDESHTRIEPSVSATAYAQASLGIPGASIGVRGDVTLIRLGFPLTVDGGYGGPRAVAPDALSARILAAQTLRLLTGHISLVLEFPFDTYTKRIFGWQGPSWTNEVIRDELAGPLLVLLEAFGVGDARARQPVEFDPGLVCEVPHPVPELGLTYFDFDDEHVDLPARRLTSVPFAAERDDPAAALTWGAAGVQTGLPGVQGQAFALDAGAAVDLSLSDLPVVNFSYSLWVNPAAAGPATLLALGDADGTPRIQLDLDADNRLVSVGGCGAAFSRRLVSAEVPVAPGEWHQVGVTYDLRAQQVGLYLDGRLMDTREGCDLLTLGDSRAIARPLPGGQGVPFVGRIDDFARWDGVALTPAQMAEVVERGLDGRPVAGPGAAVPAGVTALTAEGFDDRVVLRWTNPPSLGQPGGFNRVQIRADATVAPQTPAQGVLVYEGVASTATHQELTPGQTWHYRAFAAGAGDRVVPGPQALAVTVNAPPAAVAGFTATPGVGHAALRWQRPAAPDVAFVMVRRSGLRHPGPAEGQLVYRGQGEAFTDEVLDGGRQYYTAFAQDYAGNLSPAARAQADILAVGDLVIQPPPAVESLVATPGDRQVRLDWTLTAGRAAERIEVIRREVDGFGTARFALGPVPSYTDAALINGRRYEYLVRAFDRLGRPGAPQVVVAAPEGDPRPAPPRGFDARAGGGAVTLQWEPAANPEEIVVIRRSTQTAPQTLAQGTEVARGGAGLFVDAAVEAGRRYHYSAFTLSAGGLVSLPTSRSVRLPDDAAPPPAVTALRAVPGPERVQLLWTLPDAADLAGVRVAVAPVAPVVGPEVLLFDGLADAVVHSPADAEVTYRYRVLAYDHSGNESPAVTVEATPGAPAGPQAEAGADQATLGGAWIWLDGSASAAPPGTFYTWTQIGGPAVRIVNANRPLARFLAPDGPGELTFELTVRQGAVADRDRTVVRLDGPPAALPPEPAEERLAISEFELSLHASVELVVAHEPQAQQIHLIDPETRQVLGQFPVSAGRFVGVDAGRAAFLSDGRTLITIDVSDPAAPAELAPLPIDVSFDGTVVLASGRALAFNRRTGELRLADATPEGWAVRFDTTVPDGRVARDVVVHGDFAYVAIAATQALPEGVQALDLTGQEAVWGSVEAVPGHSITRLLVADDDLLILGLPADPVAFRLLRVGLADPSTPGPVVPLAGDFAQPDLFQSLAAVAGQLFAISIARPGLEDAVALEADRAAVGPGFPGPDAPAGAFALWPPEAPQEVWVPAEGSGAAPGVVSIHALDVPRGLPWPAVAAASAPTVVA
ncbi:MAG: LamG domain-containing protein, partial [Myxococcales bacterium]|nr:LamG domain-containing protein [Myxococcales bacterium]